MAVKTDPVREVLTVAETHDEPWSGRTYLEQLPGQRGDNGRTEFYVRNAEGTYDRVAFVREAT